jgi:hypothetical protein
VLDDAGLVVFAPWLGWPTIVPAVGESVGLPVEVGVLVGEPPVPVGVLVGDPLVPVGVLVGDPPVPVGVLVGDPPVPVGVLVGVAEDVGDGLASGEPLGVAQLEVSMLGYRAAGGAVVCPEPVT